MTFSSFAHACKWSRPGARLESNPVSNECRNITGMNVGIEDYSPRMPASSDGGERVIDIARDAS
jgi:hypothetical protein